VKVSGFRGYYLKNEGAQMQMALMSYTFNKLIAKGFMPFITPTLVKEAALIGSGHFPAGKEEIYQIGNPGKLESGEDQKDPLFLAGTSEPSLLAYNMNEILSEADLPLKYCGFSTCYRSEIGSYGKDTKGIYRLHEFMKIEQVLICKADIKEGLAYLEELRKIAEEILQDLKLPYHVVAVCTGDMGAGKYKMYDIETWMPSRNAYAETHSDSFLTDWQARRLNLKYKTKSGETKYAFTLNNTAIASPRILIAIWENYQNEDGSITIPEVLRPYLGNQDKIKPKK
jgi:seryl-tRNA synthetase